MIFFNEFQISEWAYKECKKGNDTKQIRNLITSPSVIYYYCRFIEDKKEMWSKIKHPVWARDYCNFIKDRPEVRRIFEWSC